MGTGSVVGALLKRQWTWPTVPVPFFGRRPSQYRGKWGQAPSRRTSGRVCHRTGLGASPHFPLDPTDFAVLLPVWRRGLALL